METQTKNESAEKFIPVLNETQRLEILSYHRVNQKYEKEIAEIAYDLGANSYIVKPVESDNFFQAIKEIGIYWMILNVPRGNGK